MRITFNKQTALRIIRMLRRNRVPSSLWRRRTSIIPPDPSPGRRFTRKLFDSLRIGPDPFSFDKSGITVVVPDKKSRLRLQGTSNTVYESTRTMPPNSFIEVEPGIAISSPELLFVELADEMSPMQHLMLGHELCGSFSRDPLDWRNGPVTFWCPPVTSRDKIDAFLRLSNWNQKTAKARETVSRLSDNAWSPTESVIAAIASLPLDEFGYELGPCILNERVETSEGTHGTSAKESRVPDILFEGTPVGLNYDGAVHLNLDSVVSAAMALERDPGSSATQKALDSVVREVRAKAVDDIRRNRELAAAGYIVFPVTKEDLYEENGFDAVILQVMATIENLTERDLSEQRRLLDIRFCRERRQQMILSALPGSRSAHLERKRRAGHPDVVEVTIGF